MIKNLKEKRIENGMSQQQLGEKLGISQQSINKYENHSIEPDISTLIRIADLFNTSVDFLVGHSDIDHKLESLTPCHLNDAELNLIEGYRQLSESEKDIIQMMVSNYKNYHKAK